MKQLAHQTGVSIKNILVPTDFSEYSEMAIRLARTLAGRNHAKIHVAHVVNPATIPMISPEAGTFAADRVRQRAAEELRKLDRESILGSAKHECLLREGYVWEQLQAVIRERQIDLVVTGTHGPGGFEKLALGSVAEEIFRNASCPVVTVGPLISSECASDEDLRCVLYATDFSPQSLGAAEFAVVLAQEHGARLVFLHVIETLFEKSEAGMVSASDAFIAELKKLIPADAELWCEPEYRVEYGDPSTEIIETAIVTRANMIVLGVLKAPGASTHMPWSIASKIVRQAPCPVLTVRGGIDAAE
jgi:nucleotide-binding universal stress UspA family protein